uniref:Uncharacterized protein n=1 Tax=Balaenoptera musculus TaxID=9771 RepID=A0A8C0I3M6_BALMU
LLRSSSTTCGQTSLLKIIFSLKMLTCQHSKKKKRGQKNGCQRLQYLSLFK